MKDWKAPRRASRVSTAARSIPFPASSRRSELFCHAQRGLSLTAEDGRNPTAVLPGLVRGDEATRHSLMTLVRRAAPSLPSDRACRAPP